ncbi:ABC transporter [Marinitoga sp. 1135]|uniref:ABC-type Mn2+/Zn2+ transport system, permease component n=1 Tax=Marinitoga piezophila (strain DSM 14283 / JCM 11233 / KA3) TaxID=443254 RepID=H2J7I9_MARPK|nr:MULTISPECIES: metal ABC transporter permease [Marinitoga]AEX86482.1 ABC-type Mn2+/Zn2+ transport system, permease component [Marinitoga piezophila KA3]APT76866.1 ABC transporter [Marinitoga sp. 1137]NUU96622.1 ABC transporter [Marinitoga sp. 1135]NUU98558.1 ABC transporter [Marinitoga sp. 1138]
MIELFSYDFMVYAILSAVLAGFSASLLSNYIVLKKMEFIGEGAAHTAFGGIALAILIGFNIDIMNIIVALLFGTTIFFIGKKGKINENSVIGMLLSFSMALGVIFLYLKPGYTPEITSYLFGDILMVTQKDVIILSVVAILILSLVILFNKELKYYAFNPRIAKIYGVPIDLIGYIFLITVSIVVVTTVKIIGIILVTSLLITPGVIAKLFAKTLNQMLIISSIIGIFSGFFGIVIAYYLNIPPGPSIVVTLFTIFVISYLLKKLTERIIIQKK